MWCYYSGAAVSEILAKYVSEKKPAAAARWSFVISLTGIYLHNIAYITSIRRSPRTYNNYYKYVVHFSI